MGFAKKLGNFPSLALIKLSLLRLKQNIIFLPFAVLSDLLFLFLYGFLIAGFLLNIVAGQLVRYGAEITKAQPSTLSQMLLQESARPFLIKSALLILLMLLIIYSLYCLFQGFSWWCCRKISGIGKEETKFLPYLQEFFKTNIFWFFLYIIYTLIVIFRDYASQEEPEPSAILGAVVLAASYFAFISYSMLADTTGIKNIKRSFAIGIKKAKFLIPTYMIAILLLFAVSIILSLSERISNVLFMLLGAFLLMPAINWARVYMIMVVHRSGRKD